MPHPPRVQVRRVHEQPQPGDGQRVLVNRRATDPAQRTKRADISQATVLAGLLDQ